MKFSQFLEKALSEKDGTPSSIRLNIFITVAALIPSTTFTLIWVVIFHPDLITTTLGSVLAFLAAVLGIKVWQKGKENNGTHTNTP
jgi:hypothetical protein